MNHIRYRTASGETLADADIDELANEVETTDYDTQILKTRRRGRPLLGSAPAEVVPVQLEPELHSVHDPIAETAASTRRRSSSDNSPANGAT